MRTIKKISNTLINFLPARYKKILFFFAEIFSTGLFIGKIPFVPGTFGSLLGIFYGIYFIKLSILYQIILLGFIITFGTFLTYIYLVKIGDLNKDPKEVVIDEIVAVLLFCLLAEYITPNLIWEHFLSIFVLFRFFDIVKPYPISYIDKNIHGAIGIMLDDIVASICAWIIYILAYA